MFVDGEALASALSLLLAGLVVLAATLIAHLVWVARLARSLGLRARTGPERTLLVALALATPVLSFYAVKIDGWWKRRRADVPDLIPSLAIAAVATLAVAAMNAARVETRYAVEYRTAEDAMRIFVGQALVLLVVQALLFMVARVIAGARDLALDHVRRRGRPAPAAGLMPQR